MELSHSTSVVIGVIFSSFVSISSLGRMTCLGKNRSSQHRHSCESRKWIFGVPSGRVAMLRKEKLKDPHGKYGELVKIFITTMAGTCESHWTRVRRVTKGTTFAWSECQKMVTIPSFPLPTPSVTRIVVGMISLLLAFLPEKVMKLTLDWPHSLGLISLAESHSDSTQKWRACKQGSSSMDIHSSAGNDWTKLGSTRRSL